MKNRCGLFLFFFIFSHTAAKFLVSVIRRYRANGYGQVRVSKYHTEIFFVKTEYILIEKKKKMNPTESSITMTSVSGGSDDTTTMSHDGGGKRPFCFSGWGGGDEGEIHIINNGPDERETRQNSSRRPLAVKRPAVRVFSRGDTKHTESASARCLPISMTFGNC